MLLVESGWISDPCPVSQVCQNTRTARGEAVRHHHVSCRAVQRVGGHPVPARLSGDHGGPGTGRAHQEAQGGSEREVAWDRTSSPDGSRWVREGGYRGPDELIRRLKVGLRGRLPGTWDRTSSSGGSRWVRGGGYRGTWDRTSSSDGSRWV